MNDGSAGWEKRIWEKIIKENMVPFNVRGSKSIYKLNDKKNKSVEIQFGARNLPRYGRPTQMQPTVGQKNVTLDISGADFLIVDKHPTAMRYRQYIPWKKIVEIVFLDA